MNYHHYYAVSQFLSPMSYSLLPYMNCYRLRAELIAHKVQDTSRISLKFFRPSLRAVGHAIISATDERLSELERENEQE